MTLTAEAPTLWTPGRKEEKVLTGASPSRAWGPLRRRPWLRVSEEEAGLEMEFYSFFLT